MFFKMASLRLPLQDTCATDQSRSMGQNWPADDRSGAGRAVKVISRHDTDLISQRCPLIGRPVLYLLEMFS